MAADSILDCVLLMLCAFTFCIHVYNTQFAIYIYIYIYGIGSTPYVHYLTVNWLEAAGCLLTRTDRSVAGWTAGRRTISRENSACPPAREDCPQTE